MTDQPLDVRGGNRALGAGDADAALKLVSIKLLTSAILLDHQRRREDRALIGAEALVALNALAAPADASMAVVRGIENLRIVVVTVRATHADSLSEQTLEPYVGVPLADTRTYGHVCPF